jgi:hypothetical protein
LIAPRHKKYFVPGAVANKGVYTLDRPIRVIEAIARAGGLETGSYEERTVKTADLQRSFLVRNGSASRSILSGCSNVATCRKIFRWNRTITFILPRPARTRFLSWVK